MSEEINPEYLKATHLCVFLSPGAPSIEDQIEHDRKWQTAYDRRQHFLKREPEHSIFTHCLDCHKWGVNLPEDPVCGHCQKSNTIEYFPCGRAGNLI